MWLDTALVYSPAQPYFHWRAARRLTVLAYHGIDNPVHFEQQLDYVKQTMQPVSPDEVLGALAGRRGLPKRAVLITFDDGARSLVEVGLPLLRERGLPGAAFIVAGLLDSTQPYWWVEVEALVQAGGKTTTFPQHSPAELVQALKNVADSQRLAIIEELRQTAQRTRPAQPQLRGDELATLEAAGIAIGNHSLTHPCLTRCPAEKIVAEISQAHHHLTATLGHTPRIFAYPNGNADPSVIQTLKSLGYEAAFLFDHRLNLWPPPDLFRISRVRVNSDTNLNRFRIIVSGLHPALHYARGGA